MFITQRYTLSHAILYLFEFIGGLFLEKWENQHRSTVIRAQYCFKNG